MHDTEHDDHESGLAHWLVTKPDLTTETLEYPAGTTIVMLPEPPPEPDVLYPAPTDKYLDLGAGKKIRNPNWSEKNLIAKRTLKAGEPTDPTVWSDGLPLGPESGWALAEHELHFCKECCGDLCEFDKLFCVAPVTFEDGGYELQFHTLILNHAEIDNGVTFSMNGGPLDLENDPEQFGRAMLHMHPFVYRGEDKTPSYRGLTDPKKGDTELRLDTVPADWHVGDAIIIPDCQQRPKTFRGEQHEDRVIEAIEGSVIRFTSPLEFDHRGAVDENGNQLPDCKASIVNRTRGIIVRSLDPANRGHWMACCEGDVQGVWFQNNGRTTSAPLDSTTFNADGSVKKIGTNQVGRYNHFHFPGAPYQVRSCTFDSDGPSNLKWNFSCHGAHDSIHHRCVFVCHAYGAVTEAGSERDNEFTDCVFINRFNNLSAAGDYTARSLRGVEGKSGLWLTEDSTTVDGCKFICCEGTISSVPSDKWTEKRVALIVDNEFASCGVGPLNWGHGRYDAEATPNKFAPEYPVPTYYDCHFWHCESVTAAYYANSGYALDGGYAYGDAVLVGTLAATAPNNAGVTYGGAGCPEMSVRNFKVANYYTGFYLRHTGLGGHLAIEDCEVYCNIAILLPYWIEAPWFGNVMLNFKNITTGNRFGNTKHLLIDGGNVLASNFNPFVPYTVRMDNLGRTTNDATDGVSGYWYFVMQAPSYKFGTNWPAGIAGKTNAELVADGKMPVGGKIAPCLVTPPRFRNGFVCQE